MFHTKIDQCKILSRFAPSSLPFLAVQCLSKARRQTISPMQEKWGGETRSAVFPTPGPLIPAILVITYFSLGGKHSYNQSLHICKSDKKKYTEKDKYHVELQTPICISKWQTELGEGLEPVSRFTNPWSEAKAGHSAIKHLVLESDHLHEAAFHLREDIAIHSLSSILYH